MIYLEKNINTSIALTLTESSKLAQPYFLFHFKNEINGTETFETFTDTSGYPESYNLFTMQLDYVGGWVLRVRVQVVSEIVSGFGVDDS